MEGGRGEARGHRAARWGRCALQLPSQVVSLYVSRAHPLARAKNACEHARSRARSLARYFARSLTLSLAQSRAGSGRSAKLSTTPS